MSKLLFWSRELTCALFGHRWQPTYNPARHECSRCRRRRYLMIGRDGSTRWQVGN